MGTFSQLRDWHVIGIEIKPQGVGSTTNNPPKAVVNGPDTGIEDISVTFDGTGSSDLDNDSLTYSWDFGDGSTGSGASPSHTYTWGESFTVTLTVTDGKGGSDSAISTITISEVNDPPVAVAGGPYSGTINQEITFDGSDSFDPDNQDGTTENDQNLSYSWDFGDTLTGTGVITTHSYSSTGSVTAKLTVSDGLSSDFESTQVSVNDSTTEVSVSSISPESIFKGKSTDVTIQGSGFVDGATVSLANGSGPTPSVSNVTVVDGSSITATITVKNGGPPRASTWEVIITNPDSSSGILDGVLTVTPN